MKLYATLCLAALLNIAVFAADSKPVPSAAAQAKKTHQNVDAETFDKVRKSEKDAVVLDFNSPDFDREVAKLDKSKTYLVHCASGGRSGRACKKMDQMDFEKVYNLQGGMGAWEKAGKPVTK